MFLPAITIQRISAVESGSVDTGNLICFPDSIDSGHRFCCLFLSFYALCLVLGSAFANFKLRNCFYNTRIMFVFSKFGSLPVVPCFFLVELSIICPSSHS